ncbi:MAG: hypothetical protein ACR2FH_07255 [Caulobacteraceae bacterium]
MTTAIVTDHLFHDPLKIASSLSLVVGPAAVIGSLLFWRAASQAAVGSTPRPKPPPS